MVKHTQTIRRQEPTNYLSVFDHFVGLVLKGLILEAKFGDISWQKFSEYLFQFFVDFSFVSQSETRIDQPFSCHWSLCTSPENSRKLKVF